MAIVLLLEFGGDIAGVGSNSSQGRQYDSVLQLKSSDFDGFEEVGHGDGGLLAVSDRQVDYLYHSGFVVFI